MNDTAPLAGQVALVTGASSGLGRATAHALAREGAGVALLARSAADLAVVADELRADGHPALPLAWDLADSDALEGAVGRARAELAPLRVLVNVAATDAPGPVSDLTVEAWDRVLAVNLRAVFLLSRLAIPDMVRAGQGTLVNVSSASPGSRPRRRTWCSTRRSSRRSTNRDIHKRQGEDRWPGGRISCGGSDLDDPSGGRTVQPAKLTA